MLYVLELNPYSCMRSRDFHGTSTGSDSSLPLFSLYQNDFLGDHSGVKVLSENQNWTVKF